MNKIMGIGLLAVLGAAVVAAQTAGSVGAQTAEEIPSRRYRATVVEVEHPETSDGAALTLKDLGGMEGAIVPAADGLRGQGYFGALPEPNRLLGLLAKRGRTEVLFRGEVESDGRNVASITSGTQVPVTAVELRGDQTIVTTKFYDTGFLFEIKGRGRDDHTVALQLSAISGMTRFESTRHPQISKFASKGSLRLPDGYTAVYSFFLRTQSYVRAGWPPEPAAENPMPDGVKEWIVLLTRMDLR